MMEILSFWLLFTAIGALIGHRKGRILEGVIAGLLLGPIGVLWIAFAEARPVCPECGGFTVKDARKCRHCGSVIAKPLQPFHDSRFDSRDELEEEEAMAENPAFNEQLAEFLKEIPASKSRTRLRK
jgi:rRNA maturation protein Nop10